MLKINNLTKIFNLDQPVENHKVALNDISLHIEKGDFVTVIGGNGSGKSTLMNMICGVYSPEIGEIIIDGTDVTKMSEHKRAKFLGRVFQDPNMGTASNMNIQENMELAMRRDAKKTLKWGFKKNNEKIFKEKLAELDLGLENRLNQKIGLLSGGQRQAITLLMATMKQPKILLLDEHTAALDPKTASTVLELTEKVVKKDNITTIMITHNMKDAIRYGNRLIMLSNGKIVLDVKGEEKQNLTIDKLIKMFENTTVEFTDAMLLSK